MGKSLTFWRWIVVCGKSLILTGVFCLVIAAVGRSMGFSYFWILPNTSAITLMVVVLVMIDFEVDVWILIVAAIVGFILGITGYGIGLAVIGILQWIFSQTLPPSIVATIYVMVLMSGVIVVPWSVECISNIFENITVSDL